MGIEPDQVDALLSAEFVEGIEHAPIDEVRAKRDACQRAEAALSYVRRVLQGELDLIGAEEARRAGGGVPDATALVGHLPEILASPQPSDSALHQPMPTMAGVAAGLSEAFELDLSAIGGMQDLVGNVGLLGDAELAETSVRIRVTEARVSARRRRLHERIDQLQTQVVKRYKDGEADVGALLRQGRAGAGS